MSIPFTVLGGYLGAGKTTLVNHLLGNAQGERLALIINDFGAINIDAELISGQTDDQINLTNGCICCGMSAGFDEAIDGLMARNPQPDRIIVEASGVADVVSLAQYGHHPGLVLDGIIVLADAETVRTKAHDKYVGRTVLRQLQGADLIVLNKVDLTSTENGEALEDWLKQTAPDRPIVRARYGEVPVQAIFGLGSIDHPAMAPAEHGGHETYATWQHTSEKTFTRSSVEAFLAALPAQVLRGKGFLRTSTPAGVQILLYQQVGQRTTLTVHDDQSISDASRIVMIGLDGALDTRTLDDLATQHLC